MPRGRRESGSPVLTPGQTHDIHGARGLLTSTALLGCLIGDKAYDADDLRNFLAAQGTKVVISPMPNRTHKPDFDVESYKQRDLIARTFCRIKDWRAIATRYDKIARNVLTGLCLTAAVTFWIR